MTKQALQPHALMFPYPSQGHISPMMQLAKRMMEEGFFITFVNSEFNHQRMFRSGGVGDLNNLPNLRFKQIPDGLPDGHGRFNEKDGIVETMVALEVLTAPMVKLIKRMQSSDASPPLTCIIADAISSWMQDVANQFGIPRISLWTTPVHASLAYTFQSTLTSKGLIPVTETSKLLEVITCIEGIAPMKLEDYISFFLVNTSTDFLYQWSLRLCMKRTEEAAWNLGNNLEELESDAVNAFKKGVPNFLPIGPLLPDDVLCGTAVSTSTSLLPEDTTCLDWLSQHDKASVIYVSFGSIVSMSEDELANIVHGLEESGVPFIWVVRPDQGGAALAELRAKLDSEAVKGNPSRRALVVSWVPQLAVLRHPSVGLFFSHCGWNSLIECIVAAGVPILAKPGGFAEQRMNAHYIEEVWKIGLQLPSPTTVSCVTALVCTLLGSSPAGESIRQRAAEVQQSSLASFLPPAGPSFSNFRLFIDDMHKRVASC